MANNAKKVNYPTFHFNGFTFSGGNAKLGECISFSTSCLSCDPTAPCFAKCYAQRLANFRKNVRESYDNNYELAIIDRDALKHAVNTAFSLCEGMGLPFRWHVCGDIIDADYMEMIVNVSRRHPAVKVVLMTKRYAIVNEWLDNNGGLDALPENLRKGLAFSEWEGFPMPNPYKIPIAGFIPKKQPVNGRPVCPNQLAKKNGITWTCNDCARHNCGCFAGCDRYFLEH